MIKTSDLYLAAYLKTKKHKLNQIYKQPTGKTFFIFETAEQIDCLDFFNDGLIPSHSFKENIQTLKQIANAK